MSSLSAKKEFFNLLASPFEAAYFDPPPGSSFGPYITDPNRQRYWGRAASILAAMKLLGAPVFEKQIVDYGCGPGLLVEGLKQCGAKYVIGYDSSTAARELALQHGIANVVTDITQVIRPAELVICLDVLEHIPPSQLGDLLGAIKDVLAARYLLVKVPLSAEDNSSYIDPRMERDPTHLIRWTRDKWISTLLESGFTLEYIFYPPDDLAKIASYVGSERTVRLWDNDSRLVGIFKRIRPSGAHIFHYHLNGTHPPEVLADQFKYSELISALCERRMPNLASLWPDSTLLGPTSPEAASRKARGKLFQASLGMYQPPGFDNSEVTQFPYPSLELMAHGERGSIYRDPVAPNRIFKVAHDDPASKVAIRNELLIYSLLSQAPHEDFPLRLPKTTLIGDCVLEKELIEGLTLAEWLIRANVISFRGTIQDPVIKIRREYLKDGSPLYSDLLFIWGLINSASKYMTENPNTRASLSPLNLILTFLDPENYTGVKGVYLVDFGHSVRPMMPPLSLESYLQGSERAILRAKRDKQQVEELSFQEVQTRDDWCGGHNFAGNFLRVAGLTPSLLAKVRQTIVESLAHFGIGDDFKVVFYGSRVMPRTKVREHTDVPENILPIEDDSVVKNAARLAGITKISGLDAVIILPETVANGFESCQDVRSLRYRITNEFKRKTLQCKLHVNVAFLGPKETFAPVDVYAAIKRNFESRKKFISPHQLIDAANLGNQ